MMPTIDELGTRAAANLRDDMRTYIDVEARLASLHARGATVTPIRRRVPPRAWGAIASVAIIAVGSIGFAALRHGDRAVPSSTSADTTATVPATTAPAPTTTVPAPTTTATVDTAPRSELEVIGVSYASPPPTFEPRPFTTVSPDAQIGVTETGAVVATDGSVYTVDWDGTSSAVTNIPWTLIDPVVFDGVVYGLAQPSSGADLLVMVSAALAPDTAGVLSTTPVSAAAYVELPVAPFGLGRDGIVDRVRDVGATLVPYAADSGSPRAFEDAAAATMDDELLVTASSGQQWQLTIERDPTSLNGPTVSPELPGPLPGADGTVVYSTFVGSPIDTGSEYTTYRQPVLAQLNPDGTGLWWSLPDGWTLAATDVFGTILRRETDNGIELARFPDSQQSPATTPTPSLNRPIFNLDGCSPTWAREQQLTINGAYLWGRADELPIQVYVPTGGTMPDRFAVAVRSFTNLRSGQLTADTDVNGQPARATFPQPTWGELMWQLPDGSDAYLRTSTMTREELIDLAETLDARPADSDIPAFDTSGNRYQLIDEGRTPITTGTLIDSACEFDTGGWLRATIIAGSQLGQALFLTDRSYTPAAVRTLDDDRTLIVTGRDDVADRSQQALETLRDATDAEWGRLTAADPSSFEPSFPPSPDDTPTANTPIDNT